MNGMCVWYKSLELEKLWSTTKHHRKSSGINTTKFEMFMNEQPKKEQKLPTTYKPLSSVICIFIYNSVWLQNGLIMINNRSLNSTKKDIKQSLPKGK